MNFRLTAALFAGVLVLVAGLFVAMLTTADRPASGGLVAPLTTAGLKEKDVDAVELARTDPADGKLVFAKVGDGRWQVREPVTARADGLEVDAVVRDLFRAAPANYPALTNNLTANGLAPPTLTVTLRAGGREAKVNVGKTTVGGDKAVTFVTTADRPRAVVAVPRTALAAVFKESARGQDGPAGPMAKWLTDYRSRRPLGADVTDPASDLRAVKLSAGGKDLALERKPDGDWVFAAPAGFGKADVGGAAEATADRYTGVRPLLDAITRLAVGSADDFIEAPEPAAKYGLAADDPGRLRIELTPQSGAPEVLLVGNPVEDGGKPVSPPKVYAKVEGDPAVMKLPGDRLDVLRRTVADPSELRNRDLLAEALRDRIDAIDLTAGGATTKLRKVPVAGAGDRRWVLYGGPGDPQEARQSAVTALLTDLTRPRAARDVLAAPADPAFAAGEQKAVAKLWANATADVKGEPGKLPPEPAVKGTPIELVFGKKEADLVFLRRVQDGRAVDLKVAESLLAAAAVGRPGFLDLKLKAVDPTAVTRLRVDRGSGAVAAVAKADGNWAFVEPADRKGRPADPDAVAELVSGVTRLAPVKVTHEGPSADALKGLGLDPAAPRLRATVGTAGNPDEVTFDFGAEAGDKGFVYARQAGRDAVFTVPAAIVERLRTADLRDPALYRLDPAQVTGLKVRGWRKFSGVPLTFEYDKSAGGWVAKSPPTPAGVQPDAAKIGALLTALSAPKAEAQVGPVKPEYGLNVDTAADAVEVTLSRANNPPLVLTLGAAAKDGLVYATSSLAPNEAVTFNPSAVKAYLDAPAGLQSQK